MAPQKTTDTNKKRTPPFGEVLFNSDDLYAVVKLELVWVRT